MKYLKYLFILILVFSLFSCGPNLTAIDKIKKKYPDCDIYLGFHNDEFIAVCHDGTDIYYIETDISIIDFSYKLKRIRGYEELIGK